MSAQEVFNILAPVIVALIASALTYYASVWKARTSDIEAEAERQKKEELRDQRYDQRLLDMAYDSNNRVEALEEKLELALKDLASSKDAEHRSRIEINQLRSEVDHLREELREVRAIRKEERAELDRARQTISDLQTKLKECLEAQKDTTNA